MKLTSPPEKFAVYVKWLREQGPEAPAESPRRRVVEALAKPATINNAMIKQVLGERLLTWRDMIQAETHRAWAPETGNAFYVVNSIPEQIAKQAFEAMGEEVGITSDDIRTVMAMKAKAEPLVLPKEVARTLDDLRTNQQKSAIYKFSRKALGAWKKFQLVTPLRFFKYKVRNMSGDAEATLAGNPAAFRFVSQATRELWAWFRERTPALTIERWMESGGFQSGVSINELEDLQNEKHFAKLMRLTEAPAITNPWTWWFDKVGVVNEFTEAILRYANYLEYLDQMKSNSGAPKNFGASSREDVMALPDVYDRAYKLSNELIGAYDALTEGGKTIRDTAIPFWSFQEVNFKRTKWLLINAARDQNLAGLVGRKLLGKLAIRSPYIAMRVGMLYLKMMAAWAIYSAWNYGLYGEAEASLPKDIRSMPHVALGNDGKHVRYFSRLGNIPDLLEWIDPHDAAPIWNDFISGRRGPGETMAAYLRHLGVSAGEKTIGSAAPWLTVPLQGMSGLNFYPDITRPRMIRDRAQYFADQLQMGAVYKYLEGKPMGKKGEVIPSLLRNSLWYEIDPKQAAYNDILDLKREFYRQKTGKKGGGGGEEMDARREALYNMKASIRLEDEEAFRRYMIRFVELGGTAKQIQSSAQTFDPLYKMGKADRADFMAWLQPDDRKRLFMAQQYFEETFGSGRLEEYLQKNADIAPVAPRRRRR
jgi:hypothetical protein